MNENMQLENIFNFLIMKEAYKMGMIDDKTWLKFIMSLMPGGEPHE